MLAIVQRIAEDHGGDFILCERPDGLKGARVQLYLPSEVTEMNTQEDDLAATG